MERKVDGLRQEILRRKLFFRIRIRIRRAFSNSRDEDKKQITAGGGFTPYFSPEAVAHIRDMCGIHSE